MAKGKTATGRLGGYVHDDWPFGGNDPPAVVFSYSRDRRGDHPRRHRAPWSGILQADACGGYGELYTPGRRPGRSLRPDASRTHGGSSSSSPSSRHARRAGARRPGSSIRGPDLAQPLSPMPQLHAASAGTRSPASLPTAGSASRTMPPSVRCAACLSGASLGCSAAPIAAVSAPAAYSLIQTCRLNNIDPQAWLADVLARIAGHPVSRLDELLPWKLEAPQIALAAGQPMAAFGVCLRPCRRSGR